MHRLKAYLMETEKKKIFKAKDIEIKKQNRFYFHVKKLSSLFPLDIPLKIS